MKVHVSAAIARPPAEAFHKLADCRNETRWNSQVSKAELKTGEPVGVGTRFQTVNRGKQYTATIATHDDPNALVFDVTGPIDMTATFRLQPQGDGSLLDGELDMRPNGFMRVLFPFIKSSIKKDADKQYENFARFCEAGQP